MGKNKKEATQTISIADSGKFIEIASVINKKIDLGDGDKETVIGGIYLIDTTDTAKACYEFVITYDENRNLYGVSGIRIFEDRYKIAEPRFAINGMTLDETINLMEKLPSKIHNEEFPNLNKMKSFVCMNGNDYELYKAMYSLAYYIMPIKVPNNAGDLTEEEIRIIRERTGMKIQKRIA